MVLAAVSCAPDVPDRSAAREGAANASAQSAALAENRISVGPKAAALAYMVAEQSPLLAESARTAISQDFHGAPVSGDFAVHTVTADRVSCRTRTDGAGEGAQCSIDYGADASRSLAGEDAKFLYDALGAAGVEAEGGMSHLERTITQLSCTVDDKLAQTTSSTGDVINGFSCEFTAA